MAENRSAKRLRKIRSSPPFTVSPSAIDWYKEPNRPKVADRVTWLGCDPRDESIRLAFEFYELDHTDPRHWRILIRYLADALFARAGAPRGKRPKTKSRDEELLKRSKKFSGPLSGIAQKLKQKYPRDYSRMSEERICKILRNARSTMSGEWNIVKTVRHIDGSTVVTHADGTEELYAPGGFPTPQK